MRIIACPYLSVVWRSRNQDLHVEMSVLLGNRTVMERVVKIKSFRIVSNEFLVKLTSLCFQKSV